ncbi:MAG: ATP-binding cassette domain-containing protein [Clostridia bacterium]|nr:ATP-binding cassette domain-containing protein [Clostridia bacterium]
MIVLKGIYKSFDNLEVLNNLNLNFKKNKITCLLGYSGIGKTTLLNILAGLESFDGEILNLPSKISYSFQNPSLIPNLTVKENLLLVNNSVSDSEITTYLKRLDIESLKNKLAKNLSFGEKQRVNFLRAILYNPELLLIDESFSSLDIKSKLLLEKLLKEYKNDNNITVITVTHDLNLAFSLADEIIVLSKDNASSFSLERDSLGNLTTDEKTLKEKMLLLFNV